MDEDIIMPNRVFVVKKVPKKRKPTPEQRARMEFARTHTFSVRRDPETGEVIIKAIPIEKSE